MNEDFIVASVAGKTSTNAGSLLLRSNRLTILSPIRIPLQPLAPYNEEMELYSIGPKIQQIPPASLSPKPIGTQTHRFRIEGMTCAGCASSLQRALEELEDVQSASVSFVAGNASVESQSLDLQSVINAAEKRGFRASPIDASENPFDLSSIEKQQQTNERRWRHRAILGMSLWLPLEILHWTAHVMHWHGAWMSWLMFLGALVILIFAGSEFFRSAWVAARNGTSNMDTLIALGATTAFTYSTIVMFGGYSLPIYFAEASGLLGVVSLGHWFEARASAHASSSVRELLKMQPETVEVWGEDGTTNVIKALEVNAGTVLLVRPGGRIGVDGVVIEGQSAVDQSIVTGESIPVDKGVGDSVVAGSINTTGALKVRTTVDGHNTTIARMAELVQKAQSSRAPIQRLADQVSSYFVPTVLTIAAITCLGWWASGDFPKGIISAVTVLIVSCPCALGLATPMAVMVGTGAASERGILIRNAEALERIGRSESIVFDKTGTLTVGMPRLSKLEPANDVTHDTLLQIAASVEEMSEHPIAKAIVAEAKTRNLRLDPVSSFQALPGQGVIGTIRMNQVQVVRDEVSTARVLMNGKCIGTISVTDMVRTDALTAMAELKRMGMNLSILSGDRTETVQEVATAIGIPLENTIANATPESKTAFIQSLGPNAIMVGDGINDAAALAGSGVGVALASGTVIAAEAASVIIPGDRVQAIPDLVRIARSSWATIKQNLFFAFFYNALAIPVAALGLLGESGPLWAALAMGASDITVVGNALRLKRRLRRWPKER
jgi:Cu+-exporting ATPase